MVVDHKTKKIQSTIIPSPSAKKKSKIATVSTSPQFDDLPSPSPKERVKGEKGGAQVFRSRHIQAAHHSRGSNPPWDSCPFVSEIRIRPGFWDRLCRGKREKHTLQAITARQIQIQIPVVGGLFQSSKEKRDTPVRFWMHWFTKHSSLLSSMR